MEQDLCTSATQTHAYLNKENITKEKLHYQLHKLTLTSRIQFLHFCTKRAQLTEYWNPV